MSDAGTAPAASAPDGAADDADARLTGGNYELLRRRLSGQLREMTAAALAVDAQRVEAFGSTALRLTGASRIATDLACVPRDIARIADTLIVGYNTELELGAVTPEHVFALFAAESDGATGGAAADHPTLRPIAADDPANFLAEPAFREAFDKLYRFYGKARFIDLRVARGQLLAVFSVGERPDDIQVLRWTITPAGEVVFADARGDRDYTFPDAHDIDWTTAGREDQRAGAHPTVSVLDEVFVGFRNGRLQLRVDDGAGSSHAEIDEAVDNPNQSLTDVTVRYAALDDVLLITVSLYAEGDRTYVFSRTARTGRRVDAAGTSLRALPDGDGVVFPGGYHLAATGTRTFDVDVDGLILEEVVTAPNGEDVLYVFHRRSDGAYLLMPYNLVRREIAQVIAAHGFAIFDDGDMVLFRGAAHDADPSVTHPIQWWQTPFSADDRAPAVRNGNDWVGRVGNAALVSGIGAILDVERLADAADPSRRTWEHAAAAVRRIQDTNLWLGDDETDGLRDRTDEVAETLGSLIDEYAVRERKRAQARSQLTTVTQHVRDAIAGISGANSPDAVVTTMGGLRRARAEVAALSEVEHADLAAVDGLIGELDEANAAMSGHAVDILDDETAFASFHAAIDERVFTIEAAGTAAELDDIATQLDGQSDDLDAVVDTVTAIEVGDATVRTRIVRAVADVTGALNRARAALDARRRSLESTESAAAFDAEIALVEQTLGGSVASASTPEECDTVLARVLVTIERLESRYGADPERGAQLAEVRNAVHEAVNTRRSALVDERNRRAARLVEAGERLCATIERRAGEQEDDHAIEAFFATDQMCARVRELADELDSLGDSGRAAELRGALRGAAESARRRLRDSQALGDDDGAVVLGAHRLAANTQPFESVLSGGDGRVSVVVTGTDYSHDVTDELAAFADLLDATYPSETPAVSRSEYLAWVTIAEAEADGGLGALLSDAAQSDRLGERIVRLAETRHHDGYQRGVHDADAARIVAAIAPQLADEPLLRYTSTSRGLARLWWASTADDERSTWTARIGAAAAARDDFGSVETVGRLTDDLREAVDVFIADRDGFDADAATAAARYLFDELASGPTFGRTDTSTALAGEIAGDIGRDRYDAFVGALTAESDLLARFELARDWVRGFVAADDDRHIWVYDVDDVAADLAHHDRAVETRAVTGARAVDVDGLIADHPRIVDGVLTTRIDALAGGAGAHYQRMLERWPAYTAARAEVLETADERLRLDEHRPQVMSGFVRNALIDDALLPLFGGNLARQCGTIDATDLARQGLLVVVSPPGYGKTTLMEWLADRLGMLIVKVNGPALGVDTVSLDPADAPNATARAEVEKINLACRLGRNVMLYLDDIQHTSPVLLSRFIPLADATRRIEGVVDGKPHTFDLRGKRFCVVMAGNPYTTGGGRFEMPDMLVNRSDVFNLGDVSASHADAFAASYLENSTTANPSLAPFASRLLDDLPGISRMAAGEIPIDSANLDHQWDASDLDAAVRTVRHLARARDVLLRVNGAYIASASTSDDDRAEPAFLLQGSYRNMARIAARVVAVMTDDELDQVVDEHYAAEAQTLTDRAEVNLLAYRNLSGRLDGDDRARWTELVEAHRARQASADPAAAIVAAIGDLADAVKDRSPWPPPDGEPDDEAPADPEA